MKNKFKWDFESKLLYRGNWTTTWSKVTGLIKLPDGKDMITLGGESYDDINNPKLASWSELSYLMNKKIIKPSQYYSIEEDLTTQIGNEKIPIGNWIQGDFVIELKNLLEEGRVSPGIINFDCCGMARRTHKDFGKVLHIINAFDIKNVFVSYNTAMQAHHLIETVETTQQLLLSNTLIRYNLNGWKEYKPFKYKGRTINMCNFTFYRK
jgi:hypothetical protein